MKKVRLRATALAAICALALAAAPAGQTKLVTTSTSSTAATTTICDTDHVHFAKTKFLFHTGLGFGVFHHFIWKPFKAGAFKAGASGRTKAFIKAGAAALFVVHELKEACQDANSSSVLRPLLTPLDLIVTQFNRLAARVKSGKVSTADLTVAESSVAKLGSRSGHLGLPIKEITTGFSGG